MYGAGEFDAPDGFAALHHAAGVLGHAVGGPEGAGRPAPAPEADVFCTEALRDAAGDAEGGSPTEEAEEAAAEGE